MSWKIVDVKIWFNCTSYASRLCKEKEKNKEMVVWNGNENEKAPKMAKMKWKKKWEMEEPQRGRIKKRVRSLRWKTQKFISRRLRMGSIFGYKCISFGESPRTTMHCVIVCKHLHHVCIWNKKLYYLMDWHQLYDWIYYSRSNDLFIL